MAKHRSRVGNSCQTHRVTSATWQTALISGSVSVIVSAIGFFKSRGDLNAKLNEIHDRVTEEHVKKRIRPYKDLMVKLEPMSRQHEQEIVANRMDKAKQFAAILHNEIYGLVGILASNDTREILVYSRAGWIEYGRFQNTLQDVQMRVWAIHQALRSDLGLPQPAWENEVNRRRKRQFATNIIEVKQRVDTAVHILYGIYGELQKNCWLIYKTLGYLSFEKRFSGIILDMDGLIVDSEVVERSCWQTASERHGYVMSNDLFAELVGRNTADVKARLLQEWQGLDERTYELIRKEKIDRVSQLPIAQKVGARELLAWSHSHHVPTAVASSTEKAVVIKRLEAAGVSINEIDVIVGGDEVTHGKPAPDIFRLAATRLHLELKSCLVLEDSVSGIAAACAAGAIAVLIPDSSVSDGRHAVDVRAFKQFESLRDALAAIETSSAQTPGTRLRDKVGWPRFRGKRVRLSRQTNKDV